MVSFSSTPLAGDPLSHLLSGCSVGAEDVLNTREGMHLLKDTLFSGNIHVYSPVIPKHPVNTAFTGRLSTTGGMVMGSNQALDASLSGEFAIADTWNSIIVATLNWTLHLCSNGMPVFQVGKVSLCEDTKESRNFYGFDILKPVNKIEMVLEAWHELLPAQIMIMLDHASYLPFTKPAEFVVGGPNEAVETDWSL